ncbi:TPA: hypothetical protein QDB07_001691 [Burkholderia vietnamiensis]|uniref:hypothetical protein n=1 Tax=Burkholderia vietnamiensis TaxID=60552 RepID=UPI001B99A485|nr:hypothetical protein [Burkholderia vietnamiensis]MBR8085556.1 hypothetical protein [Burkholderia vietnamiensis]HDR9034222.1 hypothetical protein [Burkholderia vietnamiensis]
MKKHTVVAWVAATSMLMMGAVSANAADSSAHVVGPLSKPSSLERAAKQDAEIAIKLTLSGPDGSKQEVRLHTREGQNATYNNFVRLGYVASVDGSGSELAIRPATLKTGLSVYVEPGRINENGQVLVRFKIEDSSLASLRDADIGGSTVQLPDIRTRALDQTIVMKSGVPVQLDANRDGKKTSGIEAEVEYTTSGSGRADTVGMGEKCEPNGIISMHGSDPVFCEGGVWTVAQYVPVGAASKRD